MLLLKLINVFLFRDSKYVIVQHKEIKGLRLLKHNLESGVVLTIDRELVKLMMENDFGSE